MATLTYSWQELDRVTFYSGSGVTDKISLEAKLTGQSVNGNYSTIKIRILNIGNRFRTTSGEVALTGAFTDTYSCATYPDYIEPDDTIYETDKTIYHASDGNASFSVGCTIYAYINSGRRSGTISQVSCTLPKINRLSVWTSTLISIPNIENSFTLPITKYVASYYDVVEVRNSNGTTLIKTINNALNGDSVTFDSTELNTILTMDNNATTPLPIRFFLHLKTYTNSSKTTQIGSTQIATCEAYLVNGEPTFTYTMEETDANVLSVFGGQPDVVIRYASDLKFTISATPLYQSTISSVKVNGAAATLVGSDYVVTISNASTDTYSIVVTDSRGLSSPDSESVTLVNYVAANVNGGWTIERVSPVSSDLKLNATINAYNDDLDTGITNSVVVSYSTDGSTWTTIPSTDYTYASNLITITNLTLSNVIAYNLPGTFYLKASDSLTEHIDHQDVAVGVYTFAYGKNKMKINGDLILCDSDGNNPVNVNNINSSLVEEYTTYIAVTQSTDNQLLWQKTINKGLYLFVCNVGLNYYGANGRDLFTYLYLNGTEIDSTDGVINVSAYALYRPVIKIIDVTSDSSILRLEVKSTAGNYLVNTSRVQLLRLK